MLGRFRRAGAGIAALAGLRVELFALELREQFEQWLRIAVLAMATVVLGCLGLGFVAVFLTVAFWDSQPLVALGLFALLFVGGATLCARQISVAFSTASAPFPATLAEFRRDAQTMNARQDDPPADATPVRGAGAPLPSASVRDTP